ncbi:MAG TPA: hypothetical protein VMU83_16605 [Hanamia sp.]|nr:hypothetical protein [Hanamia sp.]
MFLNCSAPIIHNLLIVLYLAQQVSFGTSGTEDIYKIYSESFNGKDDLKKILEEAQVIVDAVV